MGYIATQEAVSKIARLGDEPGWLEQKRLSAWSLYEKTPMPVLADSPTQKHYTNLSSLEISNFKLSFNEFESTQMSRKGAYVIEEEYQEKEERPLLEFSNGRHVGSHALEKLVKSGVVIANMRSAVREYPDVIRKFLMIECVGPEDHKLAALQAALWSDGVFVLIPEGVEAEVPLRAIHFSNLSGTAIFTHTLIVAEKESKLNFVEKFGSPNSEKGAYHSEVTEIFANDGAKVFFHTIQDWSDGSYDFSIKRAILGKDCTLKWVFGSFGSALSLLTVDTYLEGTGSGVENLGVFFGVGNQQTDISTNAYHKVPYTSNEILTKGAGKGAATSVYRGMIDIEKEAKQTSSFMSAYTLLLSEKARSNAIPSLEIKNNDVKAKHATAVSQVDEEQVFYLMTRGVDKKDAERMVVEGFFEPVLRRVEILDVGVTLHRLIGDRMKDDSF